MPVSPQVVAAAARQVPEGSACPDDTSAHMPSGMPVAVILQD
jgi:hypothetical protein